MELSDLPQSSDLPLVSVIVPTYGDERFLEDALQSVASQTHGNIELILIDSSGVERLEQVAERTIGVRYAYEPPKGVSQARNRGIQEAEGEFIAFLDADDYFSPEKIEKQVSAAQQGFDIVYTDAYNVNNGKTSFRRSMPAQNPERHHIDFYRYDGVKGNIPTSSILVRSELLEDETFDPSLEGGEDYHLWVRLFKRGTVNRIADPLVYIRQREESLSSDSDMMFKNRIQAVRELPDQYPELKEYREERELLEKYNYGRELLQENRTSDARTQFFEVFSNGYYRAIVLIAISFIPGDKSRMIYLLDAVRDALA